MPIFEYRCAACDHVEEVLQKHSDPPPPACLVCGKAGTLAREMSLTSFQLKGGGWYKDLYASSSKNEPSTTDAKSEAKTETKSESKTETKRDSGPPGGSSSGGGNSTPSGGGASSAAAA